MTTKMSKASKVRFLVVGALLACAAIPPIAAAVQMPQPKPAPAAVAADPVIGEVEVVPAADLTLEDVAVVGEDHGPRIPSVHETGGSVEIYAVKPLAKAKRKPAAARRTAVSVACDAWTFGTCQLP